MATLVLNFSLLERGRAVLVFHMKCKLYLFSGGTESKDKGREDPNSIGKNQRG